MTPSSNGFDRQAGADSNANGSERPLRHVYESARGHRSRGRSWTRQRSGWLYAWQMPPSLLSISLRFSGVTRKADQQGPPRTASVSLCSPIYRTLAKPQSCGVRVGRRRTAPSPGPTAPTRPKPPRSSSPRGVPSTAPSRSPRVMPSPSPTSPRPQANSPAAASPESWSTTSSGSQTRSRTAHPSPWPACCCGSSTPHEKAPLRRYRSTAGRTPRPRTTYGRRPSHRPDRRLSSEYTHLGYFFSDGPGISAVIIALARRVLRCSDRSADRRVRRVRYRSRRSPRRRASK